MKFIVLLFTILLQKQTKKQGYRRKRRWFSRFASPFKSMAKDASSNVEIEMQADTADASSDKGAATQASVFLLLVILPGLAIGLTIDNLQGLSGSIVALILQVALLLYILGRDDFSQKFDDYRACWSRKDYQGAFECAQGFLGVKNEQVMQTPCQLHQAVSRAMVHAWFLRFFVFVFWYLALGVGGALTALLCYWFYSEFKFLWSKNVVAAIEWAPSRLLALTTVFVGDFTKSFPRACSFLIDVQTPSHEVLSQTVFPESVDEQDFDCESAGDVLQETNQLMFRCAVIWLILVAILTVFTGF